MRLYLVGMILAGVVLVYSFRLIVFYSFKQIYDIHPSHQNRVPKRDGRAVVGSVPYSQMHSQMESQVHHLEQEAYSSVLRAFLAQSDSISWVNFSFFYYDFTHVFSNVFRADKS